MSHWLWNKDMKLEQLIRISTILGWRFILNSHCFFLSLIMKNLNLLNTAQKTLLFVKLKKKRALFQSNWFYGKIAVTLCMTGNTFHKTKMHFNNRPLIKHRLWWRRQKNLMSEVKNNNTNLTFNKKCSRFGKWTNRIYDKQPTK